MKRLFVYIGFIALSCILLVPARVFAQNFDLVDHNAFRVCADPANDPMSDKKGDGFENKIAVLFAKKLGLPLQYSWFPMGMGFIRKTLRADKCDVVIGYSQGNELVQNTNHYYTSAYALIVKKGSSLAQVTTLSDKRLVGKRIGIVAGSPPATYLVHEGLIGGVKSYPLMVDRRYQSPVQDMLKDLEAGKIDAAVLWGPLAGPFLKSNFHDLKLTLLIHEKGFPPLFYRITMGVRRGETVWKHRLNALIRKNQGEINQILYKAGVPLLNDMGTKRLIIDK